MKTKNVVLLFTLLLSLPSSSLAQPTVFPVKPWKATLKILGEDGLPVVAANVSVFYTLPPLAFPDDSGKYNGKFSGVTDTNGIFSATHVDRTGALRFQLEKAGYYASDYTRTMQDPADNSNDRNISLTMVLKKIVQPIPMYAKRLTSEPTIFNKTGRPPISFTNSAGYDLMAGDWDAPYGKGRAADLVVTEAFDKKSVADYDYKLTITFPNIRDGIQEFAVPPAEKCSALRSPYQAPASGYESQLVRENFHHPGQPGQSDYDESRNYFFRVHTILDENGNIKSALYGKIYGDPERMNFRYYLNPTPNDRNVEFDPEQNLIKDLKFNEQVKTP